MVSEPPVSRIRVSVVMVVGSLRVKVLLSYPKTKWSPARYSIHCDALKKRYRATTVSAEKETPVV